MSNLNTVELKVFIPSKDFNVSKQFYSDLGFIKASDQDGVAYFHSGNCSFLLQDFYDQSLAENLMMHLLVEDIASWHKQILNSGIADKYSVTISNIIRQPWAMLDFVIHDPSGVQWWFAQNI